MPVHTMGRIDVVLPDRLDQRLRVEAVTRYGGKKGSILRAVTEALEKWLESDEDRKLARKFAKTVKDPRTPIEVKKEAVGALAKTGMVGVELLAEIGSDHNVPESVRSQALKAIDFPGRR